MIPWPIALLTALYAALATCSFAGVWRLLVVGQTGRDLAWSLAWTGLSGAAMLGLALMKPWGRRLAVWTSALLMASALCAAWFAVARPAPQPRWSFVATGLAAVQMVVIRYLTRPRVKRWFVVSSAGPLANN